LTDGDTAIKKTATHIKDEYFYKLIFEQDKNTLIPHIDIIEKNANDDKKLRKILEMLSLSITQDRYKHGLGYNNLLFIATELILLNQENSTSEQFSLLMIEEPEAHLHPQLQMKLLDFVKTKTQSVSDNIQCILTTHSPNIASKASPQDIIMMNNGQAFSMRDNERLLEEENYKFLEKFLDVTKANLFFARGIILVEGLAEQILIPTIAKLLGYPLEDYGISVIAVNGTSWEHFARIFLSKDENKPHPMKIAILRDLDLRPVEAEKKDGNVFGFINRTEENEWWWIDVPDGKQTERRKQDLKKDLDKQNVKIFISDEWTFEYCLADKLKDECKDALKKCFIKKSKLSDIENTFATNELYRIYLMKNIAKSEFAYHLSEILSEKYKNDKEGLKSKLPNYITQALEYIVGME
jgi:putative ATP-dependent endonuclease of OLD family